MLAFFCLGLWPNTFKRAGSNWRFELFYFDFAVGAILLAVIAAFTFGTLGSEMAFDDRMLVAGKSAQVSAIGAGFLFNLGNMLFVAAVSLLGISAAVPLSAGVALIIVSFFYFRADNIVFLISGMVLLLITLVLSGTACRLRDLGTPTAAKGAKRPVAPAAPKAKARRTTKGILIALLSGIPLGLFFPLFIRGEAGDFGLGPYAGILLFCVGVIVATLVCNFYFMNIAIEGGPIPFNAYFRGRANQHFLGFAGGAIWAAGALAATIAAGAPSETGPPAFLRLMVPLGSALLVLLCGVWIWKEFPARSKSARVCIALTALLFAGGLALTGTGLAR